jgi:hypothetical membrane protein
VSAVTSGGRIDRPRAWGPILYVASVQYFIIQLLVSLRWTPPYNWSRNAISDLGNTSCDQFKGRYVCSPLHPLMNVSFLVLGITMILGSVLLYRRGPTVRLRFLGFGCLAVGGVGAALVGFFPENVVPSVHAFGAALPFLVGNVGIVLLGCSRATSRALRWYTLSTGVVALVALAVYTSGHYVGLGEGGLERVVAYPQTVWMIVIGAYLLVSPNGVRRPIVETTTASLR